MSYNIYMLYHYGDTIVPDVNSNITCNGESILLFNVNIGMSYVEIKKNNLSWI
jgi:hypothetical protein